MALMYSSVFTVRSVLAISSCQAHGLVERTVGCGVGRCRERGLARLRKRNFRGSWCGVLIGWVCFGSDICKESEGCAESKCGCGDLPQMLGLEVHMLV